MDEGQKSTERHGSDAAQIEGNDKNPDLTKRDRIATFVVLGVVALIVWAVDFSMIVKGGEAGSAAANAIGASLVGIGGLLIMAGGTTPLDWSHRNWRPNTLAAGGLLVGIGGVLVAHSAWQTLILGTGPVGP